MTPDEFKALFPQFSDSTNTVIQTYLTLADTQVNAAAWGDKYAYGLGTLTAHMMVFLGSDGNGSSSDSDIGTTGSGIKKEKVGDVEVEYIDDSSGNSNMSASDKALMATKYGREHLRVRGLLLKAPKVLNQCL